ncbi:MAG: molybdopterin molybdotransferase MoeA [Chloroflexi bacterium]|nr:molybdopterin molybdotransferase MoeA [Chloroflexota bacterium]
MPTVNPVNAFTDTPLPAEAWRRFIAGWQPQLERELVSLQASLGRYLCEDIYASGDLPAFPRSTVDGFAVQAADLGDASVERPVELDVTGEVVMGQEPTVTVARSQAVKIHTGAMLPAGASAVVMVEWTVPSTPGRITVSHSVEPGGNTIAQGEDVHRGELLLRAGRRLRPDDLGGLAAIGCVEVPVARRPVVAIISGGDEVVPPHVEPGPAQVRDVNSTLLAALVQESGGQPWLLGISRDDPVQFKALVETALRGATALIVSGGSSIGTRDLTRAILDEMPGARVAIHGIAVRPGKPTLLAWAGGRPFFGLPGNPVSAFATFRLFVRPCLERLQGATNPERVPIRAVLTRDVPPSGGREDYIQVRVFEENGEILAEPVLGKSNLIFTVVRANGLIRVPSEQHGLPTGATVAVWQY